MSKTLYSVYRYIVLGLFLIINIWLFLLSIFSTSRLTADASERTYYTGDHVWLHIIILVVLIAAVFYLVRNMSYYNWYKRCCLGSAYAE